MKGTLSVLVIATLLVLAAFAAIDLLTASSHQSHLGRLFESIGTRGSAGFTTVVRRKLNAVKRSMFGSVWRFVPLILAPMVAFAVWRDRAAIRRVDQRLPELRAGLAGIALAGVLGFALNDSGVAIPGMMLAVTVPTVVVLTVRLGCLERPAES